MRLLFAQLIDVLAIVVTGKDRLRA